MFANVGQTLQRVLVDTTVPSFSHGHTYVALSRTPTRKAFHMWFKTIDGSSMEAHITNVVYKDWTCGGGVWVGSDWVLCLWTRVGWGGGGGGELRDCDMVTISPCIAIFAYRHISTSSSLRRNALSYFSPHITSSSPKSSSSSSSSSSTSPSSSCT